MRQLLNYQFIRFLLVGGMNTAFSYGLYAGLVWLGLNYVVANLAATVLGILFSFRSHGQLVFRNTDPRRIARFFGNWMLIWLANVLLIGLLMRCGLNAYWAGGIALLPTALASYLVQKFYVFHEIPPAGDGSKACQESHL